MQYEIVVDFNDQAHQTTRTVNCFSELSAYLEAIPNMLGFEINGGATITIKQKRESDAGNSVQSPR